MSNSISNIFKKKYEDMLELISRKLKDSELTGMIILAVLVGIIGGLGAVAFYQLISLIKNIFYGADAGEGFLVAIRALPWYHRIAAPVIGGLIIGPLVTFVVKEAKGHGVPEVMEAVGLRSGIIRARVAPLKAIISAICIGSGGSAGREGPIVQIGAGFGSALGQFLKLSADNIEVLLSAGAAAGIAGTFNAPVAGVIFSLEVLLKDIKLKSFSPVVVASVTGSAVANMFFGQRGAIFNIPTHNLATYWEFIPYIGLGFVAAFVALLFENSLYFTEHVFEKLKFPEFLKPALGAFFLALLALMIPQIHATGYPVMELALSGSLPFYLALVLMLGKILATNMTLGSGGSGGIFAPSLFIGSMMGSTYGSIVHTIFPNVTAGPGSYAIIGMGAVFAGAAHAPLTAIIILFEMTRDPKIFLPMMLVCIISTVTTSKIQKKNIYTTKLLNRGINLDVIGEATNIKNIKVKDAMSKKLVSIYDTNKIKDAKVLFAGSLVSYIPVLTQKEGNYVGMLSYRNLMNYLDENENNVDVEDTLIKDMVFPSNNKIYKEDSIIKAIEIINNSKAKTIPVFSKDGENETLVGVVSRSDILDAYHKRITGGEKENMFNLSERETLKVKDIITFAVQCIKNQADNKNISIKSNIEDNLPEVSVNSNKIIWVLTTLLSNAIRYTQTGSHIEISAYHENENVYISVKDNGPGIPLEVQKDIFEKFSPISSENRSKGKGLALAISKEIVSAHNGKIWVESEEGEGAKFTFSLEAHHKDIIEDAEYEKQFNKNMENEQI
ncbi:chloride channel protein [Natronospora cellulosivora (SeqCode)]